MIGVPSSGHASGMDRGYMCEVDNMQEGKWDVAAAKGAQLVQPACVPEQRTLTVSRASSAPAHS